MVHHQECFGVSFCHTVIIARNLYAYVTVTYLNSSSNYSSYQKIEKFQFCYLGLILW